MYGDVARSETYKRRLLDFLRRTYTLDADSLAPAKRGYYGETWRVGTPDGPYFLKVMAAEANKPGYIRSFALLERLRAHGVDFVSRPIAAQDGRLYAVFDGAIVGLFAWIDGENRQDEQTKPEEYRMMARVYAVPAAGLDLPADDLSTARADVFYAQWTRLKADAPDTASLSVLASLDERAALIGLRASRLAYFAAKCGGDLSGRFISHGDAGGNVLVTADGYRLVDWDDARIAPPERDAWFCLHWPWAMDAFDRALREGGIGYALRPERLAYYGYHYFLNYLTFSMDAFLDLRTDAAARAVEDYFSCWIEEELAFADRMA